MAKTRRDESGDHQFGSNEHPHTNAPRGTEPRAEHEAQAEHREDKQAGLERGALEPVEESFSSHGAGRVKLKMEELKMENGR